MTPRSSRSCAATPTRRRTGCVAPLATAIPLPRRRTIPSSRRCAPAKTSKSSSRRRVKEEIMVLLRRLSVLVILAAAFGCQSSNPNQGFVDQCVGTFHGNPNGYAPLVCVGVSGSTATPLIDPLHVYPHGKNGAAV